jgi:Sec-independent protein translocase protein TatA
MIRERRLIMMGIGFPELLVVLIVIFLIVGVFKIIKSLSTLKTKLDIKKSTTESEMNIIKGEKLKQYSVADELMKWGKLKEEGLISEEEFNQAKAKLLKGTEKK